MSTPTTPPVGPPVPGAGPQIEADTEITRVFVVGVSGYLGSALAMSLREKFEVFGSFHEQPCRIDGVTCFPMNCLNGGEIFEALKRIRPSAVLFCAGPSDADLCQHDRGLAESLHLKAPAMFFKIATNPYHFIYFSTDQVFSDHAGAHPPFEEKSSTLAVNYYGQTKAQAETMVMGNARYTHVLRLGTVYGEAFGVPTRIRTSGIERMRQKLEAGQRVNVYQNQIRSYTYLGDVVRAVKLKLGKLAPESKLYNLAGPDTLNGHEFARQYCRAFGFDERLLNPIDVERDPKAGVARPKNCVLSSRKFEETFNFRFQKTHDGLVEMAERLRTGFTRDWTT